MNESFELMMRRRYGNRYDMTRDMHGYYCREIVKRMFEIWSISRANGGFPMSLDDAIAHANERAAQLSGECAAEHRQLALWLEELKKFRQMNVPLIAAENVALSSDRRRLAERLADEMGDPEIVAAWCDEPITDEAVNVLRAEGVDMFAAHLRTDKTVASVCRMIALGADDFAAKLRAGLDGE